MARSMLSGAPSYSALTPSSLAARADSIFMLVDYRARDTVAIIIKRASKRGLILHFYILSLVSVIAYNAAADYSFSRERDFID